MNRFFLALVGLAFSAGAGSAQVDLRDTKCPDCSTKLLREPEPKAPAKDDSVTKGQEQGRRDAEDYRESKSRQDAEKNKEK